MNKATMLTLDEYLTIVKKAVVEAYEFRDDQKWHYEDLNVNVEIAMDCVNATLQGLQELDR